MKQTLTFPRNRFFGRSAGRSAAVVGGSGGERGAGLVWPACGQAGGQSQKGINRISDLFDFPKAQVCCLICGLMLDSLRLQTIFPVILGQEVQNQYVTT